MHALIGKSGNKAQVGPEQWRAKQQKLEEERNAFLPPGLINHGNTCFMNSVLQGLIATPMLVDIVRFSLPECYTPVSSRRSPQLTNGHGLGGESDQGKEQGMPLGDTFVELMEKAWGIQDERRRQGMSPRELLQRIGAKFDQYLDFRQQDAHEFLRHLLDAIRMEELDTIKKRQPPPPKTKRRRKAKASDGPSPSPEPQNVPEEERLTSFVDMVFGGRLASILVCDKCKNISCTYEDFNDLSLSIKPEDYEKAKKRDRLKTLAKKLGMRGRGASRDLDIPQSPRSSSVPSSPLRRSEEAEKSFELVLGDIGHRRRSLEVGEETPSLATAMTTAIVEEGPLEGGDGASAEKVMDGKPHLLSVPKEQEDLSRPEEDEDPKREKDEDGWIKLRRKISVGMGVKRDHKGKKRELVPRGKEPRPDLPSNDNNQEENTAVTGEDDTVLDSFIDVKAPSPIPALPSPALSPLLGASIALQKFSFVRRQSSTRTGATTNTNSPALSAATSPPGTPDIPPVSLPPQETRYSRPSSPLPVQDAATSTPEPPTRTKSPRPFKSKSKPKPMRSKSLYLRRLLADVPSSSSSDVSEIRNAGGSAWPKLGLSLGLGHGGTQSVEGCLRLFTSVEVLDGENMVGCRKCWKIQHGEYNSWGKTDTDEEEVDGEDDDSASESESDDAASDSSASVKINLAGSDVQPLSSSQELSERVSVQSAPPSSAQNTRDLEDNGRPSGVGYLYASASSSPVLPVPVPLISMTGPESTTPSASEQTPKVRGSLHDSRPVPVSTERYGLISSPSRDSLQLPATEGRKKHFRQPAEGSSSMTSDAGSLSSEDNSTDEDEEAEDEAETSMTASLRSDSSSVGSFAPFEPPGIPNSTLTLMNAAGQQASGRRQELNDKMNNNEAIIAPIQNETKSKSGRRAIPRSKQLILRRAYKRYLIATPPPVLVVHLKRFQQTGRVPTSTTMHQLHFFSNFKKLDDSVSFPEYLDLAPFLLPKKDDVIERGAKEKSGRKKKSKVDEEEEEEKEGKTEVTMREGCMYRLYAVVVHIGNMLGGHYVAYTALPEPVPSPSYSPSSSSQSSTKESLSVSSSSHSLPQALNSYDTEKQTLRPEVPRTTSFTRTANPLAHHHSYWHPNSNTKSSSRPSTPSGGTNAPGGGLTQPTRQWCHASDTVVRLAKLEEVLQAKAYICLYERI